MAEAHLKSGLERRSGIALWRQIADAIRAGIGSGLGDEDGRLPPEVQLAEEFGVNRHTVRAAISALVNDGVLQAHQGRGTFIVEPERLTYPISKRTRFSTGLESQTQAITGHFISSEHVAAKPEVAKALKLEIGAEVICMQTLRKGDGIPLVRSTAWFDAKRFPDLAERYQENLSITRSFKACGLDDYVRQSTVIEAHHASIRDSDMLNLSPGALILVLKAINTDLDGVPVEYSKGRYSADRVKLQIESSDF
ncbi:phosphonate metabolism transcriptional regulator PhnF [Cohaesibacter gelatinilyticus]|uniref:Transcriptional regulator, GntR family n=1 Tax=Cohaesibacter gelatinilyticus TaxID=372072 RepID=A0A285NGZ2_9HYPH|nr:phosphonate metabolism transcriptional regulator PhnF [Cohaesibacter gelatinilyticus]SNZ08764.1 transcriptional regulator, GntR family [Cohaesibacter gelatinilyticus]